MTEKKIGSLMMAVVLMVLTAGCGETGQSREAGVTGSVQDTLVGQAADGDADADQAEEGQGSAEQEEAQAAADQNAEPAEQEDYIGYQFLVGGVALAPDMDIEDVLPLLGESKSIYEAPSCAGQGISYLYDYASYEIETYPAVDGVNRIGYIILKDDTVSTEEGIDLSMTREDCINAYGEAYDETETKLTFILGEMKLNFIFDGDNIISIEYASAVIG